MARGTARDVGRAAARSGRCGPSRGATVARRLRRPCPPPRRVGRTAPGDSIGIAVGRLGQCGPRLPWRPRWPGRWGARGCHGGRIVHRRDRSARRAVRPLEGRREIGKPSSLRRWASAPSSARRSVRPRSRSPGRVRRGVRRQRARGRARDPIRDAGFEVRRVMFVCCSYFAGCPRRGGREPRDDAGAGAGAGASPERGGDRTRGRHRGGGGGRALGGHERSAHRSTGVLCATPAVPFRSSHVAACALGGQGSASAGPWARRTGGARARPARYFIAASPPAGGAAGGAGGVSRRRSATRPSSDFSSASTFDASWHARSAPFS